jgi:hypothetical protein
MHLSSAYIVCMVRSWHDYIGPGCPHDSPQPALMNHECWLQQCWLQLCLFRSAPGSVINGTSKARAYGKQAAHQAADQVLASPAGHNGVVGAGHTGPMVSTQHDAPAQQHSSTRHSLISTQHAAEQEKTACSASQRIILARCMGGNVGQQVMGQHSLAPLPPLAPDEHQHGSNPCGLHVCDCRPATPIMSCAGCWQ